MCSLIGYNCEAFVDGDAMSVTLEARSREQQLIRQNEILVLSTKLFQEQQKNAMLEQNIFQLEMRQELVDVKTLRNENNDCSRYYI